jgi:hypothetical protein
VEPTESKMRLVLLLAIVAVAGCSAEVQPEPANDTQTIVSQESLSSFLEVVRTGDFHDMGRAGQQIFKKGLRVPDHSEAFLGSAAPEQRGDQVRYVFHRFRGEGSVGEVSLTLARDTGTIIAFTVVEAILD